MKTVRTEQSMEIRRLMPSLDSRQIRMTRASKFLWAARRYLLLSIALLLPVPLCSQAIKLTTANGGSAEVLGGSSPTVLVYDSSQKLIATIPLSNGPVEAPAPRKKSRSKKVVEAPTVGAVSYSSSTGMLYVASNSPNHEHTVIAVNLNTDKVDAVVPVGPGDVVSLFLSPQGKRLACYAAGKTDRVSGPERAMVKTLKPPLEPSISLIDTHSNQVSATYRWMDEFSRQRKKKFGGNSLFRTQIFAVDDDGFTVIKSDADDNRVEAIAAFNESSPRPIFFESPKGTVKASIRSLDGRYLVFAIGGDQRGSMLVRIDLQKGESEDVALNDVPVQFLRLGLSQEAWLIGDREMRAMTEEGKLTGRVISLNDKHDESETNFIGGYPGETIPIGADHVGMLVNKKSGESAHKVAIVNLKTLRLDGVIPTMSAGQQAAIKTGRVALALGLTMLSAMAGAAAAPPGGFYTYYVFTPNLQLRNMTLATDNQQYLYALDMQTHAVSMINVRSASLIKRIKVDSSVNRIGLEADGSRLICYGKRQDIVDVNNAPNAVEDAAQPSPPAPSVKAASSGPETAGKPSATSSGSAAPAEQTAPKQ